MKCADCNFKTIGMKYEHKEDGKLKGYWFCHTCGKQSFPVHEKVSKEVEEQILPKGFVEGVDLEQSIWEQDDSDWDYLYD